MIDDCSDAIAKAQVYRILLIDACPDGKWQQLPLLLDWQRDRYALDLTDLEELADQLETEYKGVRWFDGDI